MIVGRGLASPHGAYGMVALVSRRPAAFTILGWHPSPFNDAVKRLAENSQWVDYDQTSESCFRKYKHGDMLSLGKINRKMMWVGNIMSEHLPVESITIKHPSLGFCQRIWKSRVWGLAV